MGYVRVKVVVANPIKKDLRTEVEFIADTGAIYTVIPRWVANKLGLEEASKRRFRMASGEIVEYPVSEAYIMIENRGSYKLSSYRNREYANTSRSHNIRAPRSPSRSSNRETQTVRAIDTQVALV